MGKKRHTKQKDIVINYLKDNCNKHLTAEQIVMYFKNSCENISQATVYRILANLSDEGIIRKYISDSNKCSCYQYVENASDCNMHYHLICDVCGRITHFENSEIKKIKEKVLKDKEFDINLQKIVFYGKCKNCLEKIGIENEKNS